MRSLLLLALMICVVSGCSDGVGPGEVEPRLASDVRTTLLVATTDAEQRLLPALAGAPGTPLVAAALADLDEALRDGRTAHVRGAAAGLGEALDQNAAAGDGVSQPDRSAIRLVLFVVEAALP